MHHGRLAQQLTRLGDMERKNSKPSSNECEIVLFLCFAEQHVGGPQKRKSKLPPCPDLLSPTNLTPPLLGHPKLSGARKQLDPETGLPRLCGLYFGFFSSIGGRREGTEEKEKRKRYHHHSPALFGKRGGRRHFLLSIRKRVTTHNNRKRKDTERAPKRGESIKIPPPRLAITAAGAGADSKKCTSAAAS